MTVAQTCFFVSSRGIRMSCVSPWRWFLNRVRLLYTRLFSPCDRTELPDHGFTYRHLFFLLFSFHFYIYLFGITWGGTYICSVGFQSTQAVCIYKVVNLACPSWQKFWVGLGFFCILCFCVHLAVKQENCTTGTIVPSKPNKDVFEAFLCLSEQTRSSCDLVN